jgi:hypothetical protein
MVVSRAVGGRGAHLGDQVGDGEAPRRVGSTGVVVFIGDGLDRLGWR